MNYRWFLLKAVLLSMVFFVDVVSGAEGVCHHLDGSGPVILNNCAEPYSLSLSDLKEAIALNFGNCDRGILTKVCKIAIGWNQGC